MTETEKLPIIHVVCAVLLDEHGHVLVAKRPLDKSLGGLWEFPGGKVEEGESLSDALIREIREELGTEVVVEPDGVGVLGTFDHALSEAMIRLHPIICRLAEDANPPEALEHLELRWVPVTEETDLDWAPGDRRIFSAVLRKWQGKLGHQRSVLKGKVFRALFWMTFVGYGLLFAGEAYDIWIAMFLGTLLIVPAVPLGGFVSSVIGGLEYPSSNWWDNFCSLSLVVLFLAVNAWLLARVWRWLTN